MDSLRQLFETDIGRSIVRILTPPDKLNDAVWIIHPDVEIRKRITELLGFPQENGFAIGFIAENLTTSKVELFLRQRFPFELFTIRCGNRLFLVGPYAAWISLFLAILLLTIMAPFPILPEISEPNMIGQAA